MSDKKPDNIDATQPFSRRPEEKKNVGVGDVVVQRYKILRHLDKGGMGAIYEAEDISLGRIVALKVMHAPEDQEGQLRFKQEASVAAQLQHPHTVKIFDYGATDSGALFLVMELLQGHTFKSEFKKGPIDPFRLLLIIRQICGALGEAHEKRIIHRDIKPSNIFITHHDLGFAKLLDFGLVKNLDGQADVSQTGIVLGSPMYMSPEQVDAQPIDQRSDIYSLGMTMYHAVAGKAPFSGTLSKILMAQLVRTPDSFSHLEAPVDAPPLLEWIIFTCIQKEPKDRFQNITQLKKAIEICEDSLKRGTSISLQLVNGELSSTEGELVDLSKLNATEVYVRPGDNKAEGEDTKSIITSPSSFPMFAMIGLLIALVLGYFLLQEVPTKESVVETKTIIQTQLVTVEPEKSEKTIASVPEGARVYWVGDEVSFCTTPCPPIQFKEGEEREIVLKKKGFKDERRKLIWNMQTPSITLTKKALIKTKRKTKTVTSTVTKTVTKTQTKTETKKDDGLLKDPFAD